jgi:EAL domain-containing protein (putative c-di-GMP-specific phosphodiesterase class I)/GGDEF domain-containing protein
VHEPLQTVINTPSPPPESARVEMSRIRTVFQPIVDLLTGNAIGYEVLSRGEGFVDADQMFASVIERDAVWDLEHECRRAALPRIARFHRAHRTQLFFVNVSPKVLEDPRFTEEFGAPMLRRYDIDPSVIVLEVTERQPITDHERAAMIVAQFRSQGIQLAVDDFGSGHSSLLALVACAPRFIKLDAAVVRDIHLHPYRRHLVRALNAFAASVDSRLVAEGVEQWEELEALLRLGVRYAQGFLFAHPMAEPPNVPEPVTTRLRETLRTAEGGYGETEELIQSLVEPVETVQVGSITVEELHTFFRDRPDVDHLVLMDGDRPRAIVTRGHLSSELSGRYAYALRQKKPVEAAAKPTLIVSRDSMVTTVASHAMERAAGDLYDPVLVVDSQGGLVGTVTIKSLIRRSVELQVQNAQGANPLSGLPGNRAIQRWIESSCTLLQFAVVYADLDRFKEYNDRYGFLMGDEMIRLSARILTRLASTSDAARLGHVGGDDFVAVFPNGVSPEALEAACQEFDAEKRALLDGEDLERGYLLAKNRRGTEEAVPIVTISLAVIERSKLPVELHPALLSHLAAALKATAKRKAATERRSAFVLERRTHATDP